MTPNGSSTFRKEFLPPEYGYAIIPSAGSQMPAAVNEARNETPLARPQSVGSVFVGLTFILVIEGQKQLGTQSRSGSFDLNLHRVAVSILG